MSKNHGLFVFLAQFLLISVANSNETCDHLIFCQGEILHTIQMSRIFSDSKTFVDMSMINSEDRTIKNFKLLMLQSHGQPTRDDIRNFVMNNFVDTIQELEPWLPSDYRAAAPFLTRISNKPVRNFAKFLLDIWPNLGRKVRDEVFQNDRQHTLIPIRNGFIVPGGRFREYYYWDSYWIIKGLLICNMKNTARGMLDNFFQVVNKYGFVPNGGRIYYLDRSQPPLLTFMAADYLAKTKDSYFIKKNLKSLERELNYWLNNKLVTVSKNGKNYFLARYYSKSDSPRPESYFEDIHTASIFPTDEARRNLYRNLRTGAESGWDFSARWIFQNGIIGENLAYTDPTRILPVDLNSFLCKSFLHLSGFYAKFWMQSKAEYWLKQSQQFQEAINEILFCEEDGIWYDYDIKTNSHRKYFFPSNLTPLWALTYNTSLREEFGKNATEYLKKNGVLRFTGGVPTSMLESGQQWDAPNAWAPLQVITIFGLEQTGHPEAMQLARTFAKRWLECVETVSRETREVFEKYNAAFAGMFGHGGEYEVQTGFGWTNGVVLELIEYYYIKNNIDLGLDL